MCTPNSRDRSVEWQRRCRSIRLCRPTRHRGSADLRVAARCLWRCSGRPLSTIEGPTVATCWPLALHSGMRYIMREHILSWGDDFTIKDAEGRDAYRVDGKVFSFGDKL